MSLASNLKDELPDTSLGPPLSDNHGHGKSNFPDSDDVVPALKVSHFLGPEDSLLNFEKFSFHDNNKYADVEIKSASDQHYSINADDYQLGEVIGFGSSAVVYLTTYLPLEKTVVIKMIDLERFERNQIDELRREIQVMKLCRHPNLLAVLASFVHDARLWIVMPFMSVGSCLDIMRCTPNPALRRGLEESTTATILYQTLLGLEYLHKHGHIHRDIKAANLLLDKNGTVCLADFGVSASLQDDGRYSSPVSGTLVSKIDSKPSQNRRLRKTFVGTPCWMAPEVMEMTHGYDEKADIWSLGITALELSHGQAPFARYPPMKVIYLTLSSAPPTLDRNNSYHRYTRTFKDFIELCLQRDPKERPTATTLLKHPFFKAAKKTHYLTTHLIPLLPSITNRSKKVSASQSVHESTNKPPIDDWEFSDEFDDSQDENVELNLEYCRHISLKGNKVINIEVQPESVPSRFLVESSVWNNQIEDRPTTPDYDVKSITCQQNEEFCDQTFQIGRFRVLESTSESHNHECLGPGQELLVDDVEEGRNSRFIISSTDEKINCVDLSCDKNVSDRVQSSLDKEPAVSAEELHGRFQIMSTPIKLNVEVDPREAELNVLISSEMSNKWTEETLIDKFVASHVDRLLLLNEQIKQTLHRIRTSISDGSAKNSHVYDHLLTHFFKINSQLESLIPGDLAELHQTLPISSIDSMCDKDETNNLNEIKSTDSSVAVSFKHASIDASDVNHGNESSQMDTIQSLKTQTNFLPINRLKVEKNKLKYDEVEHEFPPQNLRISDVSLQCDGIRMNDNSLVSNRSI